MACPPKVWNQLKGLTTDEIIAAHQRDEWAKDPASKGAILVYIKYGQPSQRVTIHYHPKKTYGPGLLKSLLSDIGWTEDDLRRLTLIK